MSASIDISSAAIRKNQLLLMLILLLDLIGFSLIFPIIPHLLDYYLAGMQTHPMDGWLSSLIALIERTLPENHRMQNDLIVILGGVVASIYSFLQFIFSPIWGKLSDKIGRRPVMVLTSSGLALSYLIWFFSDSFTLFLLSRAVSGTMAGNMGVASAAMADMTTPETRTKGMGLLGAAFGVGFVIGPLLGGVSSQLRLDLLLHETLLLHPFSGCALISFLLSGGSALLNVARFHETLPKARRKTERLNLFPFKRISIDGFNTLLAVNFFYLLFFSGFEFSLSFFYKLDFGLTPVAIGFIFFYLGLILIGGQGYLVRKLSGIIPERSMIMIGLGLQAFALIMLGWSAPYVALSMLALLPVGLGSSLVQPSLMGLASLMSPIDSQGHALGDLRSVGSLARAVGPLAGAAAYWTLGPKISYTLLGLCMLGLVLLSSKLRVIHREKD